jgi:hypothetical protein
MAEQLANSKIGRQSVLYTTAVSCIQQTATLQQAARLLASKFTAMNPWAAELIGSVQIERSAFDYIRQRHQDMKKPRGTGQPAYAESGQTMHASSARNWVPSDIWDIRSGREGQDPRSSNVHTERASPDLGHNSGKTVFDANKMRAAQSAVKSAAADSILNTLKFSDGRLAAMLPIRELSCYKNDGVLAVCFLKKIEGKYANPDRNMAVVDYLSEQEIAECAAEARALKMAEVQV